MFITEMIIKMIFNSGSQSEMSTYWGILSRVTLLRMYMEREISQQAMLIASLEKDTGYIFGATCFKSFHNSEMRISSLASLSRAHKRRSLGGLGGQGRLWEHQAPDISHVPGPVSPQEELSGALHGAAPPWAVRPDSVTCPDIGGF